jgi:hypothetical protein
VHVSGEVETKLACCSKLGSTMKLMWDHKLVPKVNLTTLYKWTPAFIGASFTYNHEAPRHTDLLEYLFGVRYENQFMAYVKQYLLFYHPVL